MGRRIKLPHYTQYVSGNMLHLDWLITISVNDYVAARHLDWHHHEEMEIIFPVHGHYSYEFKGHIPIDVDNNAFLVIPKGIHHRLAEAIDSPGLRFSLHLKKPSGRFSFKGAFTAQEYKHLYSDIANQALRSITVQSFMKSMITLLSRLINRNSSEITEYDRLRARLLCCQMLCDGAAIKPEFQDKSPDLTFVQAVKWLERNYATPISMDQLVEHIGYSRARFFTLFKHHVGVTPSEYLRNFRITKAKELITTTDLPAVKIAAQCGLGDPAHFSRLFLKMTGFTPLGFRRHSNS